MRFDLIKKRLNKLSEIVENRHLDIDVDTLFPFTLRTYQQHIWGEFSAGRKYFLLTLPRRSGKDLFSFWLLLTQAIKNPGIYYYLAPTLKMLKNIIWMSGAVIDGRVHRYIDMIPNKLIRSINNSEMIVQLTNGSVIRFVGTESLNRLRGITANGIVISEAAFGKKEVFDIINPIMIQSGGWLLLNSTPKGVNWYWRMMHHVKKNKDWFVMHENCETLLDESGKRYITDEDVQKAIDDGMSKSLVQQEFYCECIPDESKVIYAREMKEMKIIKNAYIAGAEVHFAFDLGLLDYTSVVAFQIMPNGMPAVVWCFQNNNEPWTYYYNHIKENMRNKRLGKFVLPHDSAKRNGSSVTLDTIADDFENMGAEVMQLKRPKSLDGFISLTKSYMGGMVIDESCVELIEALNQYQKDDNNKPVHDEFSHYASAFGYMCMALYHGMDVSFNNNEVMNYGA